MHAWPLEIFTGLVYLDYTDDPAKEMAANLRSWHPHWAQAISIRLVRNGIDVKSVNVRTSQAVSLPALRRPRADRGNARAAALRTRRRLGAARCGGLHRNDLAQRVADHGAERSAAVIFLGSTRRSRGANLEPLQRAHVPILALYVDPQGDTGGTGQRSRTRHGRRIRRQRHYQRRAARVASSRTSSKRRRAWRSRWGAAFRRCAKRSRPS